VPLLADHPEDLCAGLLDDLALLLDRRGVDEVLGVADAGPAGLLGRQHPLDGRQRPLQHRLLRKRAPVEILRPVAEVTGERLLDDDEGVALEGGHGHRLVRHGRHAGVDDVAGVDEGLERVHRLQAALLGEGRRAVGVAVEHADDLHVGTVDPLDGLVMEVGREPGPDQSRANGLSLHVSPPV